MNRHTYRQARRKQENHPAPNLTNSKPPRHKCVRFLLSTLYSCLSARLGFSRRTAARRWPAAGHLTGQFENRAFASPAVPDRPIIHRPDWLRSVKRTAPCSRSLPDNGLGSEKRSVPRRGSAIPVKRSKPGACAQKRRALQPHTTCAKCRLPAKGTAPCWRSLIPHTNGRFKKTHFASPQDTLQRPNRLRSAKCTHCRAHNTRKNPRFASPRDAPAPAIAFVPQNAKQCRTHRKRKNPWFASPQDTLQRPNRLRSAKCTHCRAHSPRKNPRFASHRWFGSSAVSYPWGQAHRKSFPAVHNPHKPKIALPAGGSSGVDLIMLGGSEGSKAV